MQVGAIVRLARKITSKIAQEDLEAKEGTSSINLSPEASKRRTKPTEASTTRLAQAAGSKMVQVKESLKSTMVELRSKSISKADALTTKQEVAVEVIEADTLGTTEEELLLALFTDLATDLIKVTYFKRV